MKIQYLLLLQQLYYGTVLGHLPGQKHSQKPEQIPKQRLEKEVGVVTTPLKWAWLSQILPRHLPGRNGEWNSCAWAFDMPG